MIKPSYLEWIIKTEDKLKNYDENFNCYRIEPNFDERILDEWAIHIRRHYIPDDKLVEESQSLYMTIEDYLRTYKIPQKTDGVRCGPTRSNVISEIIFSDLLEFILGYHVPRVRQYNLPSKTATVEGSDVIGYKFEKTDYTPSKNDELVICEVKAVLSKNDISVISKATADSNKDHERYAHSLNYIRTKLSDLNKEEEANHIRRFQLKPYKDFDFNIRYIAGGMTNVDDIIQEKMEDNLVNYVAEVDGVKLKITSGSEIYFIYGKDLMSLTNEVFERIIK